MKKYSLTLLVVLFNSIMFLQPAYAEEKKLSDIYSELDESIERSNEYQHKKEQEIEALKHNIENTTNDNDLYKLQFKLYEAYDSYSNAKAIECLNECVKIVKRTQNIEAERYLYTLLSYQSTTGGFYAEALSYLDRINMTAVTPKTELSYLFARSFAYGELATHSSNKDMVESYRTKAQQFGTSFFAKADKNSQNYYQLQISQLLAANKLTEAQKLCLQWEKSLKVNTKEYALMAYYMSEYWRLSKNTEKQRYWLAVSALCDVKNAIMNQASLWALAEILNKDGDLERSQRYIDYSWKCNTVYGAHLRSWQVAPVITTINSNYRDSLSAKNNKLTKMIIAISILAVLLLLSFLILYRHNKQLKSARNQLRNTNNQLSTLNAQLQESEVEAQKANLQLQDSNRVKDEYIARFLSLCSGYIDKMDNYRLKINRQLKSNQFKELLRMTGSTQLRDDETKELFSNFDEVFLKLYPNFVEEFNSLLLPEHHQKLGTGHALTTDMRMAALIRLGIDDSASIAEFMRLSPNTVYNYRARMKSKALGDRNEFENRIKEIGL